MLWMSASVQMRLLLHHSRIPCRTVLPEQNVSPAGAVPQKQLCLRTPAMSRRPLSSRALLQKQQQQRLLWLMLLGMQQLQQMVLQALCQKLLLESTLGRLQPTLMWRPLSTLKQLSALRAAAMLLR
jgi:hypothetical protein